jgi:signal transduction histidine kinase
MNNQNHIKMNEGQPETFCLNDLKEELKIYAEQELAKAGKSQVHVEIFNDYNKEKTWIHADRNCLKQALSILLDNAVKRTGTGSVMFDFHVTSAKTVSFFVDDTGDGVCDENDPNLSVARGLVQQMGGELEIVLSSMDESISVKFDIAAKPVEVNEN